MVCSKNRVKAGGAGAERARRRVMEEAGAPDQEGLYRSRKERVWV